MSIDEGLLASIEEALEPLGSLTFRKMMGGATLYLDGTVFAIMVDGEIWFKADAESDAVWDEADCARFTYTFNDGRTGVMNYRRAPVDVYDDPDAMQRWARLGLEAGLRAAEKKKPRKPVSKK